MEDPRHELLALFEGIHTVYNLKESDYKVFVETLARFNQEPRVNIEGAKYVRIAWDHVELKHARCERCEEVCSCCDCDGETYLSHEWYDRIFRVVDEHVLSHSTFLCKRGTKISKDMLEKLKCQLERNNPTLQVGDDDMVVVKVLEVLEREGTTS